MLKKEIMKHDVLLSFADFGEGDINNFCFTHFGGSNWEEHSFYIFDKFRDKNKVMIDMGGWLGITPLYCSQKFNSVVAFECDKVALKRFHANLNANPKITNVNVIEEAVWIENGEIELYAQGEFGDSESTLVILEPSDDGKINSVKCSTFLSAMNNQRISLRDIGFIKMDIEGSEAKVIFDMQNYLSAYKPTLYISIHHHLIDDLGVLNLLTLLFSIYLKAIIFNANGQAQEVSKADIINNKLGDCVFTQK
tara:strand:+ start:1061 stop:1813 length:753 start_codon:yes stop_codon:yes gene_type:complete